MAKGTAKMIKGLGAGMIVGGAAGLVGYAYLHNNKKKLKKNVDKALKSVSKLSENVNDML